MSKYIFSFIILVLHSKIHFLVQNFFLKKKKFHVFLYFVTSIRSAMGFQRQKGNRFAKIWHFFAKQIKAQVGEKAKNLAISIKIRLVFYLGSSQRSQGSDHKHENQTSIYLVSSKGSQGSDQKDENQHRN